jgi:hypothetical protein
MENKKVNYWPETFAQYVGLKKYVLPKKEKLSRTTRSAGGKSRWCLGLGTGVSPGVFSPKFMCRYPQASLDHKGRRRARR